MKRRRSPSSPASGYTLVELLVVIALVAALAGAVTVGWGRSDRSRALEAAQRLVLSALDAARTQAALGASEVLVVIEADDPASESYLRELRLYRVSAGGVGEWLQPRWRLPDGVGVVPPPELGLASIAYEAGWTSARTSSVLQTPDAEAPAGTLRLVRFAPAGQLASEPGTIVVGSARRDGGLRFEQAASARGIGLSRYGAAEPVLGGEE